MNIRSIPKALKAELNFNYKNLLFSGCSFSYNTSDQHPVSWPWYLRDLGSFESAYDCSYGGAGNKHIHDSIIAAIELNPNITPSNTLVIVMWTNYDKDDYQVDPDAINSKWSFSPYCYTKYSCLGLTGGMLGDSNLNISVNNIKKIKNEYSRALDNYISIVSLYNYLQNKGFKFLFTEYAKPHTVLWKSMDIIDFLSVDLSNNFIKMCRQLNPTLGEWSLDYLDTSPDGFHPSADCHLDWTRRVLIPYLKNKL